MIEEVLPGSVTKFWGNHRLALMIIMAITIAISLVTISMYLYISSGAIQLDLSRPGYQGVSSQTDSSYKTVEYYPETGKLDESSISEFEKLYNEQVKKAHAVDAFGGTPLSYANLGILTSDN